MPSSILVLSNLLILSQTGMSLFLFYFNFDFSGFFWWDWEFFHKFIIFLCIPFFYFLLLVILIWKLFICYNGRLFFLYMVNVFPSFEYSMFGYIKVLHFPLILYYFHLWFLNFMTKLEMLCPLPFYKCIWLSFIPFIFVLLFFLVVKYSISLQFILSVW